MKLRYIFLLGLLMVVQSVLYDAFFMDNPTKAPDIEERIETIFSDANVVADEWLTCDDAAQLLDHRWRNPLPQQWRDRGVSIYLYQDDSLCFWNNHTFADEIDSVVSPSARSIEQFDGNTVLSFRSSAGDRSAIIVVKLIGRPEWFNEYIFPAETRCPTFYVKPPVSVPTYSQIEHISFLDREFYVKVSTESQMPIAVNLFGWVGILVLLFSITKLVRRGVSARNAMGRLLFTVGIFAILRLLIYYVDIPNGGSFSWSSLGSLLITFIFLLVVVALAYSMRFRLRAQVRAMSQVAQYAVLAVTTTAMCVTIIYFHFSMVELIRVNTAYVEVYNIFSLNFDSIIFYCVCAVFVAMRILYSRVSEATLSQFPYWTRAALSIVMLIIMVLPIEPQMVNTGFILVMFHSIFLAVYYLSRRQFIGRQVVLDLMVFTAYITFFTAIETFTARLETAQTYATQIVARPDWVRTNYEQPPKSLWYAVVKPDNMTLSENNNYELIPLFEAASFSVDTIVVADGFTHIVRHRSDDSATIVVTFERPTLLRIVSLWSYIFLWLLVVSGAVMELCGLKIYRQYSHRSMIYRVRSMIFVVVIFSMGIVSVVVYRYSDEAYNVQQKNALKVSVQELRSNFSAYAEADSSDYRVMRRWLKVSSSSRTSLVTLFDTTGKLLGGGSNEEFFVSRMSSEAYGALSYGGMPYYERLSQSRSKEFAVAYSPLYWHGKCVGYMGAMHLNPQNTYQKYSLLSSIFNLFVIVLLISVFLSMVLYSAITRPLNVLYEGLSGIRNLRKVYLNPKFSYDDEIGTIITQYNAMIDYLQESYLALARSEREGAWREMARQVAHEIKNPLTPMRLKIQMLQRARAQGASDCTAQLDSTLAVLLEQIDILSRIATEFSDLARLPQGTIVRVELSGLIANVVGLYSSSECVPISYDDQCGATLYVNVDYASMSRVVTNLLQNSMQAIDGVGEVVVTLTRQGQFAVLEVRDTGGGIAPEVMERMFEPNFTTKTRGSGLGLAISRQIVENFGGSISAANGECVGAVLTVMLPLA